MKTSIFLFSLLALASLLTAAPAVTVSLDRPECLYKCGEEATFTVTIANDEAEPLTSKATAVFSNDNGKSLKTRTFDPTKEASLTIKGTMDKPSFLQFRVNYTYRDKEGKTIRKVAIAAAGFEPERIKPSTPNPDDFLDYWKGEIAKADRECPLDVQMTKMEKFSNAKHTAYKISFAAPGGRVYGFLNIPSKGGKHPALVNVPGAGPGHSAPSVNDNLVLLQMNVHPYDPCIEGKTIRESYDELRKAGGYMYQGERTREGTFFYRPIIGIARAVEWLANRPEVDASRIGYSGGSQGGAFGFILAGLTGRFAAVALNIPAMCDHFGMQLDRAAGWPQYRNKFRVRDENGKLVFDKVTDAWLPYYDAVNFARHIHCPIRITLGFIDTTCSPSSVYAAYNSIPAVDKAITYETDMGHAQRPSYSKNVQWMRELVSKPAGK